MNNKEASVALFKSLSICVVIPTYNNAKTLAKVIADVLEYTEDVIVVNDGSTDNTSEILSQFNNIRIVDYKINKGKGYALRYGFRQAIKKGYRYAIAIDSDGQHFADDLPVFINKIQEHPDSIIIGARNMNQDSVPAKSSFGYKFSNFWFRVETGIECQDTQSGFRLYPLRYIEKMIFFTRKYEFEIEVLVRLVWQGVPLYNVPVKVHYDPPKIRVSHFRPKIDFTRISILNTFLVIIAFLYIKPRDLIVSIFKKKNFRQNFKKELFHSGHSHFKKSLSIGLGVCFGIMPIWGAQLLAVVFLSILFNLNKPLAILASNISIPPMIPLILFLSYKLGGLILNSQNQNLVYNQELNRSVIKNCFSQYAVGSVVLALLAGVLFAIITYFFLRIKSAEIKS